MATVTNTITLPDGSAPVHAAVVVELVASTTSKAAGWVTAEGTTILSKVRPTVTGGAWSADLTPNADITPSGTVYKITETADRYSYVNYITVDSDGGTVFSLLSDPPGSLASGPVAAHLANPTDAHDAAAISVSDPDGFFDGDTVEEVIAELGNAAAAGYGIASTTSDLTLTGDAGYGIPINVSVPFRARRAKLRVATQTGTIDVAVYDGTFARTTNSSDVQVAPAGPMEVALRPAGIQAGLGSVWVAPSGAAGVAGSSTLGDLAGGMTVASNANPLPSSLTGVVPSSTVVGIRVLPDDTTPLSVAYSRTVTDYSVFGKIGTRLYARNITNDKFAYSDDSGATWSDSSTTIASVFGVGTTVVEIVGHTTFMFAVLLDGRLMRANLNAFSTWTDKSAPAPTGTTGRVGVFVSDGSLRIYYGNYNAASDTPGAYVYRSGSSGDTWASGLSVATARHVHAVAVDPVTSTTVWATVGDASPERGLYKSTDQGVTWAKVSSDTRYGIDIRFAYSMTGAPNRVIVEGDGSAGSPHMMSFLAALSSATHDAVVYPDTSPPDGDGSWAGSARASLVTSEGNLVWASTGEGGAIGPREGLWIAKGPWFTSPVLLEEWAQGSQPSWGRTYESGAYLFNGRNKITRPKFAGQ